ncbi:TPA: hypothetical protein PS869_001712 [Klebsiella pneumoniae]|uniref:Eaa1 n=1 Tax=Klebsiella pneumoniae subsp. pneumoniae TaxID=72407 RepID=A0A378A0Z4_KLEPN|nr:hypothetical protein [Klebsiella pneumoniae]STU90793.1 Uncharacterised protein [Klebsiella pneumoniae subsp. pneumoniae]MBE4998019.1 hypothetical protein [Klebsiella pneumoniae]STW53402.1 Uncharacterised protein [Klebsiella pneumoniae]SYU52428.1 Uncharacterised protein [Klebsiella pneumoniae]HBR1637795.1 hypothetical protein [Klebsiella pneumoniae]
MTKSTITRERLEQLANFKGAPVTRQEEQELARMALAAMDSEPVAYISKSDFNAGYPHILARRDFNKACTMPVYAEQPAPVVPDDVSIFEAAIEECKTCDSIDEHAWNHGVLVVMAKYESCRAAMLAAAPQEVKGE